MNEVAIFGYSHGGGSTCDLSWRLQQNQQQIDGDFDIEFTAYIDAVENDSDEDPDQERRRPPLSNYHANYYQHGVLNPLSDYFDWGLDGGPINPPGADFEIDVENEPGEDPWDPNATHYNIDDLGDVRDDVEERLENEVTR